MVWRAALIKHNKQSRIGLSFEKDIELINHIKQIDGSRWSQSLKVWHIPDTVENRIQFKIELIPTLSEEAIAQIQKFADWLNSKRYSPNTIKTYTEALKSFLLFFKEKPIAEITNDDVISYNKSIYSSKKLVIFLSKPNCKCNQIILYNDIRH